MQARVGIVGAGQLGRMLALSGYPLGIECVLLDRDPRSPGAQVAPMREGALEDPEPIASLADEVEVLTLEIENVPAHALEAARARVPVYPPVEAVTAAQDRLVEKELFLALGIPTAPFARVDAAGDLERAAESVGLPLVLKARRMGSDGRGQRIVDSADGLADAWDALGRPPAIAEGWISFERELSLVAVQGAGGERAYYPLVENIHRNGVLHTTIAPFEDAQLQRQAEAWLDALLDRLDYRGVLAVELFHAGGALLANEMAPRVHNSGHWTIEGATTSQFENHLRAVLGWPLGGTEPLGHAAMINLLGSVPPVEQLLAVRGLHLHVYGKTPRAGRKVGHCTLVDADRSRLLERVDALRSVTSVSASSPAPRNA